MPTDSRLYFFFFFITQILFYFILFFQYLYNLYKVEKIWELLEPKEATFLGLRSWILTVRKVINKDIYSYKTGFKRITVDLFPIHNVLEKRIEWR